MAPPGVVSGAVGGFKDWTLEIVLEWGAKEKGGLVSSTSHAGWVLLKGSEMWQHSGSSKQHLKESVLLVGRGWLPLSGRVRFP